MNNIELLSPAGSLEKLKMALLYGADAVYAGGEEFSLRAAAKNFSNEDLKRGIDFVHEKGKKIYITANIFPHNKDLDEVPKFMEEMEKLLPDGLIISDLGMFAMAKKYAPSVPIHISTQANCTNYMSANMWHELGAKRIVLAREMSFSEISKIRELTPPDLELEAFVHGAMCISYSGRCLLSSYMAGRDSNKGDCAHPCRWNYSLVEEQRPGEYMDVFENERGTFIFNSKDLCMINHIPELINSGITSFKLEGRVKTEYYVAIVTKVYRNALDSYLENPDKFVFNPEWAEELSKVSNRRYTNGFYNGKPNEDAQVYGSSSYIREYDIVGLVKGYDEKTSENIIEQRNRIFVGDEIEVVPPNDKYFKHTITKMTDNDGIVIESAPHAQQIIKINLGKVLPENTILRKKRN